MPHITPRIRLELLVPLERELRRIDTTSSLDMLRRLRNAQNHASRANTVDSLVLLVHVKIEAELPRDGRIARFIGGDGFDQARAYRVQFSKKHLYFCDAHPFRDLFDLHSQLVQTSLVILR